MKPNENKTHTREIPEVYVEFLFNGSKEIPVETRVMLNSEIRRIKEEFGEVTGKRYSFGREFKDYSVQSDIMCDFLRGLCERFPGLSVICLPDVEQPVGVNFDV